MEGVVMFSGVPVHSLPQLHPSPFHAPHQPLPRTLPFPSVPGLLHLLPRQREARGGESDGVGVEMLSPLKAQPGQRLPDLHGAVGSMPVDLRACLLSCLPLPAILVLRHLTSRPLPLSGPASLFSHQNVQGVLVETFGVHRLGLHA